MVLLGEGEVFQQRLRLQYWQKWSCLPLLFITFTLLCL